MKPSDGALIAIGHRQVCRCWMRADAISVIAEHLDNPAIPRPPRIVCIGHPRQFLPKLRENVQASVYRRKLLTRDLVGRRTIFGGRFDQSHQVRDVIETELPCMAQECQPFERSVIITSLTAVGALG